MDSKENQLVQSLFEVALISQPIFKQEFEDLDLKLQVLIGIFGYGFEKPTNLQKKCIKPFITGKDLIVQADSSTGKKVAQLIGALQIIDTNVQSPQVIILCTDIFLASNIRSMAEQMSFKMSLRIMCCISEDSLEENKEGLKQGVQFVIGTPGRILDLMNQNYLDMSTLKLLVINNIDGMFEFGLLDKLKSILLKVPAQVQKRILLPNFTLDGVKQFYIDKQKCEDQKFQTLVELIEGLKQKQVAIYCNTQNCAQELANRFLALTKFKVLQLYSSTECTKRDEVNQRFIVNLKKKMLKNPRSGEEWILVTTDIYPETYIDLMYFNLVINYESVIDQSIYIKRQIDQYFYLSRVGNEYKQGLKRIAITFTSDSTEVKEIEKFYKTQIKKFPIDLADLL